MLSWSWRRKSNPAPQISVPAPHTPPVATPVSASHRASTWPHAVDHEGGAPRDYHRHAPRDVYQSVNATPKSSRDAQDPQVLSGRLAKVAAWRRSGAHDTLTPIRTDISPEDEDATPCAIDTANSGSSSSYSGFGSLGGKMWGSTASVASAPSHMQHGRRASSARSMTINFDALLQTKAEPEDPNLAIWQFDAGREPGVVFPMDMQLPDDHRLPGATLVAKSAWEPLER